MEIEADDRTTISGNLFSGQPSGATIPSLLNGFFLGAFSSAFPAPRPPNVVLILADDFGVGDVQAHYPDNKIPNPHLVREERSFTGAHSPSAVCSLTPYGLLTGWYNWRTRLQEWVIAAHEPPVDLPSRGRRGRAFSSNMAITWPASANALRLAVSWSPTEPHDGKTNRASVPRRGF